MKKTISIVLIWFLFLGAFGLAMELTSGPDLNDNPTTIIVVEKGETLWDIASRLHNGEFNNHKVVNAIEDINSLDNVTINPGQELEVPIIMGGEKYASNN